MDAAAEKVASARPGTSSRDWILLPLLSILTVCVLLLSTELTARILFARTQTNMLDCLVVNDPKTGVRGIPNCVCRQKVYEENRPTEYRLNSRGHRAGMELRPKRHGTVRIVMVGSSIAEGMRVPVNQTLAALLPQSLSRRTGRNVEVYNEGMMYGTPHRVDLAFQEALDAQPDMILWILTPWDLANASVTDAPWAKAPAGLLGNAYPRNATRDGARDGGSSTLQKTWKLVVDTLDRSRTVIMLRHYLYKSQTLYVRSYLMQDEGGQFLRSTPGEATEGHWREFTRYASDIERKARLADIPIVVSLVPAGPQATMVAMGKWPAGFDPYVIDRRLRAIIEGYGGRYVDTVKEFREIAEPQRFYMAVDGHPTAEGHAVLAGLLAKGLQGEGPLRRDFRK